MPIDQNLTMTTNLTSEDDSNSVSALSSHLSQHDIIDISFAFKPARRHRQFLLETDECYYDTLKGYNHIECSSPSYQKVAAVKHRSGGSWLLGFSGLRQEEVINAIPELVRSTSSSSLSSEDDSSTTTSSSSKKKGVSFNESVSHHLIPHASSYTLDQRRRMYSSSLDLRQNKIRNKKEYRYDRYDWRNCTEEWEMSVCMVTGELVHPVHSI